MADKTTAHYGLPKGPTLCGASDGDRWTAMRFVTCIYCMNIADRFIADSFDAIIDQRTRDQMPPEARKERPPSG